MAKSSPVKKAWRSLTWLGVIIVGLFAINASGRVHRAVDRGRPSSLSTSRAARRSSSRRKLESGETSRRSS